MSILIRSHTVSDFVTSRPSMRMLSNSSAASTTGIYTPEDMNTPNPSLASLVQSQPGGAAETLPHLDEAGAESLVPADGTGQSPHLQNLARVLLFVPWCVTVGGAIVLFPSQLDRIVFRAGYIDPIAPGLRRFQFWHDMGPVYVKIFLAVLVAAWSLSIEWGAIVSALVAARFIYVWQWFAPQTCCLQERIGVCDMESLWLVVQEPDYLQQQLELAGITEEDFEETQPESGAGSEEMQNENAAAPEGAGNDTEVSSEDCNGCL